MGAAAGADSALLGRVTPPSHPRHVTPRRCTLARRRMVRGQSLVVWAIEEGRKAARGVDKYLMYGETYLP
jgi:NADPH-dependent glutamate synthase beta subunit-like oxidoreductase